MDSSVIESSKYPGLFVVSTTDFFYPLVENPEDMGRIACANVLSDMYAMGVVEVDNMLMILAASLDMNPLDREIVTKLMIKGFDAHAKLAGSKVSGGQSIRNPWPTIGGVANSICKQQDIIMPVNAQAGDLIILTKALGTQVAVNVKQWMKDEKKWENVQQHITRHDALRAYHKSSDSMKRLNKIAAMLMHKYGAHAATDVTGFGILGHLDNLCSNQKANVSMVINKLPILRGMRCVNDNYFSFRLTEGFSSETSGGLMICLPKENAELYCKEIESLESQVAWIIGQVLEGGDHKAYIAPDVEILEV